MRAALAFWIFLLLLVLIPWRRSNGGAALVPLRLATAVCLSVLVVLVVVVPWQRFESHPHWERVRWVPFLSPPISARDVVGNVVLYLPFGYSIARLDGSRHGRARAVAGAALLVLATEGSQLFSHGRYPSMTDVTCNVLGAWLGATVGRTTPEAREAGT